jgi:hypothetical protein
MKTIRLVVLGLTVVGGALVAGCGASGDESTASANQHVETSNQPKFGTGAATNCLAGEQTVFSCQTDNGKFLAVCASKDLDDQHGYMQYRYGTQRNIELSVPTNAERLDFRGPARWYKGDADSDDQEVFDRHLMFTVSDGHTYEVFDTGSVAGKTTLDGVKVYDANGAVVNQKKCIASSHKDIWMLDTDLVTKSGVLNTLTQTSPHTD